MRKHETDRHTPQFQIFKHDSLLKIIFNIFLNTCVLNVDTNNFTYYSKRKLLLVSNFPWNSDCDLFTSLRRSPPSFQYTSGGRNWWESEVQARILVSLWGKEKTLFFSKNSKENLLFKKNFIVIVSQ